MSLNHPSVAIVGATGAVGTELIACLEQRDFPLRSLRLYASSRSAGRRLMFRGDGVPVEALTEMNRKWTIRAVLRGLPRFNSQWDTKENPTPHLPS